LPYTAEHGGIGQSQRAETLTLLPARGLKRDFEKLRTHETRVGFIDRENIPRSGFSSATGSGLLMHTARPGEPAARALKQVVLSSHLSCAEALL
jgi:hypothetical protein